MRFCFLLFAVFFVCPFFGQQMQFESAEGFLKMPSLESYNIMQDSKGYIWFATEQGLCRYDGNSVFVFDRRNGLPEGAVYAMGEDEKGRIWMLTSKNRILCFEGGMLREAFFSRNFSKHTSTTEIAYFLKILPDGTLYINTERNSFVIDPETGKLHRFAPKEVEQRYTFAWKEGFLLPFHALRQHMDFTIPVNQSDAYEVAVMHTDSTFFRFRVTNDSPTIYLHAGTFQTRNGAFFALGAGKLVRITANDTYEIFDFPHRLLWMFSDSEGDLWLGLLKEGIYCYRNGDLTSDPIVSLKDCSVSGIAEDSEKNIWCTTLEKGVFVCRNKNVVNYFNVDGLDMPVDLMQSQDGLTFFSSQSRQLIVMDSGSIRKLKVHVPSFEALGDIVRFEGNWYLGGKEIVGVLDLGSGNFRRVSCGQQSSIASERFIRYKGALYGLNHLSLLRLAGTPGSFSWKQLPDRAGSLSFLSPSEILFGGRGGLYRYDLRTDTSEKIKSLPDAVTNIVESPYGLWISSKGSGLNEFRNGKVLAANKRLGINATVMNDLVFADGNLWIGSNSGLVKVDLEAGKSETYGVENGLPSEQILKLALSGKQLFLSTPEGVCSFDIRKNLRNSNAPRIYLRSISANGKLLRPTGGKKLAHDQNSLVFTFDALAFKSDQNRLWHRLVGRDTVFSETVGNTLAFDNLDPGRYELVVYALNSDGLKSVKPAVVAFSIQKPFWEEWWFIAVLLLIAGSLVWAIVAKITLGIKKREAEKTRIAKLIADSRLSAVQAQMNPHFIFNAINSIQNYILKKKETEAYDYFAKFSKLIRQVLQNSQQQFLSVHDELETLKLYVELEQLRFRDSFDFSVELDDKLDSYSVSIPTMMLQPYVENAIWHGLMNLDGQRRGQIRISMRENSGMLETIIEDNGVGRRLANRYNKNNVRKSLGMKLTAERLEAVNLLFESGEAKTEIEDMFDQSGEVCGTRVRLFLPILNQD